MCFMLSVQVSCVCMYILLEAQPLLHPPKPTLCSYKCDQQSRTTYVRIYLQSAYHILYIYIYIYIS